MAARDPRIDAYIAKAAPFARPILEELRAAVHAACPEVVETIKWSMPFFDYQGPLCFMGAFKAHCGFGFWKGAEVVPEPSSEGMGQLGRITAQADLPPRKTLVALIKKAVLLKETSPQTPRPRKPARAVVVPEVLAAALRDHDAARAIFESFSPSKQREYTEWISEARTETTRDRRLAQAIDLLADGKPRHWKY